MSIINITYHISLSGGFAAEARNPHGEFIDVAVAETFEEARNRLIEKIKNDEKIIIPPSEEVII